MTKFNSVASGNKIEVTWMGPDQIERTVSFPEAITNKFKTSEDIKTAVDQFTTEHFSYVLDDVYFHLNRNKTVAIATGDEPPPIWPEDEPELPG